MSTKSVFKYIIICSLFLACSKEKTSITITSENYHQTVDKLTSVIVHDVFSPPVASRIYVYPSIAAYEVLAQNHNDFKSLTNQLNELESIEGSETNENLNTKLAALIAYMDVAKELIFSKEKLTLYRDSLYNVWENINKDDFTKAKAYGTSISSHIINWMNKDNYALTRSMPNYNIYSNDVSRWKPTPPSYMNGIEPHWNRVRPMVLDSAAQFKPAPPPKFSMEKNSDFYKELIETYNVGNDLTKKGDDSEEIAIARFWDCNPYVSINKGHYMFAEKKITPGGHWIGICKIATKKANFDFENTVFTYTKVAIALNEAFISCWDEKYRSNLVRPETLINEFIDPTWKPVLQTPPFPEYTSGHSVVSGAASEVLTHIFGDNFQFDDDTEIPYGLPVRSFDSFYDAASEAAISRLYGGIHYRAAIDLGLGQGKQVGKLVNKKLSFK